MRIALLTQGFQTAGGVQAVARWLRDGLATRGHVVQVFDVASASSSSLSRRLVSPRTWITGPVLESGTEDNLTMAGAALAELEPLRYLPVKQLTARLSEYDLVQVVCGGPALARVASRSGRPTVIQVATFMKWERESIHKALPIGQRSVKTALTHWVTRLEVRALRESSAVMVENEQMLQGVREAAPGTPVVVAPPGVDTTRFSPSGEWSPTGPIVALGRLGEHRKGWDRVLKAYAHLLSEWPEGPPLVVAGRGDLTPANRDLISFLGLEGRVDVRHDLPHDDLVGLLRGGSMFWQTSHEEGLGIAALEAMACGLPVIATDTAGTRMTIRHGQTGYLVSQDDAKLPGEFLVHSREILQQTGPTIARLAREDVVARFDAEKTLDSFEEIYRSVVSSGSEL
ncbi:glycosyltransferase [Nocardioides sp. Y6]|uniref:Glycosyltransferase n=1 Tax=Nocardioides malaquae TaxID=2773426 RepID=A0ABR9RTW2_9ACTN|nr:glycosyltransferase [Nocardioides malaquae]MBE7324815.1 glycosyltransferase [Nocardioides malaquae]